MAAANFEQDEILGKAYDARLMRRLAVFVGPYWRQLSVVLALLLSAALAELAPPYLVRTAVDGPAGDGRYPYADLQPHPGHEPGVLRPQPGRAADHAADQRRGRAERVPSAGYGLAARRQRAARVRGDRYADPELAAGADQLYHAAGDGGGDDVLPAGDALGLPGGAPAAGADQRLPERADHWRPGDTAVQPRGAQPHSLRRAE